MDFCDFEASPVYRASSRITRVERPLSQNKQKKKEKVDHLPTGNQLKE